MDHGLDFRSIIPLQQVDLNVTDKSVVSLLVVRKASVVLPLLFGTIVGLQFFGNGFAIKNGFFIVISGYYRSLDFTVPIVWDNRVTIFWKWVCNKNGFLIVISGYYRSLDFTVAINLMGSFFDNCIY
jgi:hypothetical protein